MYLSVIGICWSHAAFLDEMLKITEIKYDDILLSFSSLYWFCGLYMLLKGTLNGATRITTAQEFTPELQLRLIEQYRVTYVNNPTTYMVATMKCARLRETNLSSVKTFLVGGSVVPLHVLDEMKSHLKNGDIWHRYGLSEIGFVSNYFDSSGSKGRGSAGQLVHGTHVKIVDNHGNQCAVNVDGELCIKMNFKFLGYYGNQQATDDCFDCDGFFRTGDIGHIDVDGFLFVVDRKKDILICNETLVSSSAIESHLIKMPGIQSVCVVGIPEIGNDLPAAIVVRSHNSNISEDMVANFVTGDYYIIFPV